MQQLIRSVVFHQTPETPSGSTGIFAFQRFNIRCSCWRKLSPVLRSHYIVEIVLPTSPCQKKEGRHGFNLISYSDFPSTRLLNPESGAVSCLVLSASTGSLHSTLLWAAQPSPLHRDAHSSDDFRLYQYLPNPQPAPNPAMPAASKFDPVIPKVCILHPADLSRLFVGVSTRKWHAPRFGPQSHYVQHAVRVDAADAFCHQVRAAIFPHPSSSLAPLTLSVHTCPRA
ncbi:hypothetical protein B0H15DRAFT_863237 [Mycena belliarum]|uniref:Uncharacterized protein n=1 Tax=Mycena belliarum TaxID=1033014 RepID=A0AAD6TTE2_9AGAR|nr:hypothetical protein B0H15DRAFT_863237 [Mycena belliae]